MRKRQISEAQRCTVLPTLTALRKRCVPARQKGKAWIAALLLDRRGSCQACAKGLLTARRGDYLEQLHSLSQFPSPTLFPATLPYHL